MAANNSAIWSKVGDIQWSGNQTAANTATDGTGTVATVFTADATNGGRLDGVILQAAGTNVASLANFFLNNGGSNTVAANNAFVRQQAMAATSASNTAVMLGYTLALAWILPPGYRLLMTLATAVAAGWQATAFAGKY